MCNLYVCFNRAGARVVLISFFVYRLGGIGGKLWCACVCTWSSCVCMSAFCIRDVFTEPACVWRKIDVACSAEPAAIGFGVPGRASPVMILVFGHM